MVTLWLVAVLSLLAVAISHRLALELRLVKHRLARTQAQALARGAVRYGMLLLQADLEEEPYDWLGDQWAGTEVAPSPEGPPAAGGMEPSPAIVLEVADGAQANVTHRIVLRITDEERRLNLNGAELSHLTGLGVSPEAAQAIVDYRDADEPDDPAEDRADRDPPYIAKDGPFVTLQELTLIPAVREERASLPLLLRDATVYTDGRINANTASLPVLLAVKGGAAPDPVIGELVARRAGADGQFGTLDDCVLKDHPEALQDLATCLGKGFDEVSAAVAGLSFSSVVFTVIAEPLDAEGRVRHHIEAVVSRTESPPRVIAWHEG
jgi:hypothetical protein